MSYLSSCQHNARGTLSMANSGPNTNGSQFFLTYAKQPHLNGLYTVFGKVIHGFEVLDLMEKVGSSCFCQLPLLFCLEIQSVWRYNHWWGLDMCISVWSHCLITCGRTCFFMMLFLSRYACLDIPLFTCSITLSHYFLLTWFSPGIS